MKLPGVNRVLATGDGGKQHEHHRETQIQLSWILNVTVSHANLNNGNCTVVASCSLSTSWWGLITWNVMVEDTVTHDYAVVCLSCVKLTISVEHVSKCLLTFFLFFFLIYKLYCTRKVLCWSAGSRMGTINFIDPLQLCKAISIFKPLPIALRL